MIRIQMLADGRIFVLIVEVHRCAPPTLKLCLLPQSFDFFVAFVPPVHTTLKYGRRSLIRHQVTLVPCRGPSILHAIRSILCHGSLWADRAPRPLHAWLEARGLQVPMCEEERHFVTAVVVVVVVAKKVMSVLRRITLRTIVVLLRR